MFPGCSPRCVQIRTSILLNDGLGCFWIPGSMGLQALGHWPMSITISPIQSTKLSLQDAARSAPAAPAAAAAPPVQPQPPWPRRLLRQQGEGRRIGGLTQTEGVVDGRSLSIVASRAQCRNAQCELISCLASLNVRAYLMQMVFVAFVFLPTEWCNRKGGDQLGNSQIIAKHWNPMAPIELVSATHRALPSQGQQQQREARRQKIRSRPLDIFWSWCVRAGFGGSRRPRRLSRFCATSEFDLG